MSKTITAASAEFLLSITDIFPIPVRLEGWAADSAFASENVVVAETTMGVDGKLSAGFVHSPVKMKLTLSPDSNSVQIFDAWNDAMQFTRDAYFSTAIIELPGPGSSYVLNRGIMTSYKGLPDAKKILQPIEIEIVWESVTKAAI